MGEVTGWKYFSRRELSCRCGCGLMNMQDEFMRKIVALREECGFPFPVSSASRCEAHNRNVSTATTLAPHRSGRAIDIAVSHQKALALVGAAIRSGFTGIGVKQHGNGRFVHIDDLTAADGYPRPHMWSYP